MISAREATDEIYSLFTPVEGFNTVYYGKIGNGKTRNATADILELLARGEIVFANWHIDFHGFSELNDRKTVFAKFLGGRRNFFKYSAKNFYYLDPQALIENKQGSNVHMLANLVGAHLFIDEGQWLFNSLEKHNPNDPDSVDKLKLVLHGRHYCRSLNVITQRPSNINKNIRSQVHIWYRCVKRLSVFGWIIFERWAIEDMKDDLPVEFITEHRRDGTPIRDVPNGNCKTYFVNTRTDKIFKAYNTHAMRDEAAIVIKPDFVLYDVNFWGRLKLVLISQFPATTWLVRATGRGFNWILYGKNKKPQKTVGATTFSPYKPVVRRRVKISVTEKQEENL